MIVDIILIAIIVFFAIIGLCKGFVKSLVSLFKGLTDVVIAIVLAKPIAKLLSGIGAIYNMVSNAIAKLVPIGVLISEESFNGLSGTVTGKQLAEVVPHGNILKIFFKSMFEETTTYETYEQLSNVFNSAVVNIAMVVIAFILVFLLLCITLTIITHIFLNKAGEARLPILDKPLGLLFGAAKGVVFVVMILFAIRLVSSIPVVESVISPFLDGKVYTFASGYVNGWFDAIITKINFNELIQKLLNVTPAE